MHCWWECKLVQPFWKTIWRVLKRLKIELPHDPAIILPGIYPKYTKILIQRGTCTPMFIAALPTTAKLWKEAKCPLTDKWIKKMWYNIYSGLLLSRQKEWNLGICNNIDAAREYDAKLNKSIQEGQTLYDFAHMWNFRNKTNEHRG